VLLLTSSLTRSAWATERFDVASIAIEGGAWLGRRDNKRIDGREGAGDAGRTPLGDRRGRP